MLAAGSAAPDFTLPDHTGRDIRLADLLAGGPLVLFFYPGDFTPVCTREVCMVRDLHAELAAAGVTVAGVSPDDAATHARFRERHSLAFTLLADPDKRVIRAYGVNGPLGFGVRRATFLLDRDGRVRDVVAAALSVGKHAAFLRRAIAAR
jgi:peroxiredoxin Q/BCP